MVIRALKTADIHELCAIERECFADVWSEAAVLSELENGRSIMLGAFENGHLAAYLFASFVLDECSVNRIAVLPSCRRSGIAAALLGSLDREDFSFVTLEVRRSNLPAISLYKKCGFEKVGERRGFYVNPSEDAFIMTKQLIKSDAKLKTEGMGNA